MIMTYNEFSNKLKELKLSKADFSKMIGMSYNSITNWKLKEIPSWVDPFLYHYEKSLKLDELLITIEKYKRK